MSGRVPMNATRSEDLKKLGDKGKDPVPPPKEVKGGKPAKAEKHESGWI